MLALGPGGLLAGWNVATPPVIGLSLAGATAVLILQNADTRRRVATEEPALRLPSKAPERGRYDRLLGP